MNRYEEVVVCRLLDTYDTLLEARRDNGAHQHDADVRELEGKVELLLSILCELRRPVAVSRG